MKKVYRIYTKYRNKKDNTKITCLNNHYMYSIGDRYYLNEIPEYEFDVWTPDKNEFIIPIFLTEDDAIAFMFKYEIEGFVALTVEKQ